MSTPPAGRRRRRAVGPAGSAPASQAAQGAADADAVARLVRDEEPARPPDDDERLRAERPPHHDRGV